MLKNAPEIITYSFDKAEDAKAIKKEFRRNSDDDSKLVDKGLLFITKCIAEAVCARNSNWDNNEYNKGVVEPYNKMRQLKDSIEATGSKASLDDMIEAFEMLKVILKTKLVDISEQKSYNFV